MLFETEFTSVYVYNVYSCLSAVPEQVVFPPHYSHLLGIIALNEEGAHSSLIPVPFSGAPVPPGGHTWNRPGFLPTALRKEA